MVVYVHLGHFGSGALNLTDGHSIVTCISLPVFKHVPAVPMRPLAAIDNTILASSYCEPVLSSADYKGNPFTARPSSAPNIDLAFNNFFIFILT